jgi:hypothetical protein
MPQVKTLYEQVDPPNPALRRESAELYFKENVPPLIFSQAFEVGSYILGWNSFSLGPTIGFFSAM